MALGANLVAAGRSRLEGRLCEILGFRTMGIKLSRSKQRVFGKAGVPATNTAGDDPGMAGVFIVNTTTPGVYYISAYTSSTVFTVVTILQT